MIATEWKETKKRKEKKKKEEEDEIHRAILGNASKVSITGLVRKKKRF